MKPSAVFYFAALVLMLLFSGYLLVNQELPAKSNTWFISSGACVLCHSTSDFASRDSQGNDVSPIARWRSTMLANASKDPFWKAINDSDYLSGLGVESVLYAFPIPKAGNAAKVKVLLHYETAPESWMHELFEYAEMDEDIGRFKNMYDNANRTPVRIATDSISLTTTSTPEIQKEKYRIYPNPTSGKIYIDGVAKDCTYSVFNTGGLLVKKGFINRNESDIALNLPSGNYHLVLHFPDGKKISHSIMLKN